MPRTPYLGWAYPAEDQTEWFSIFQRLMESIDLDLYRCSSLWRIALSGGGVLSWSSGTLSFSQDLRVLLLENGHYGYLSAGSVQIPTGHALYVSLPRSPSTNVPLSAIVAPTVPRSDAYVWIATHLSDGSLLLRNGRLFADGESGSIAIATIQGAGIYAWERQEVVIQADGDQWLGNGTDQTASSQAGLSEAFPEPLVGADSVDVFRGGQQLRYVSGAPANSTEWTWVSSGSPAPVIRIGPGAIAGEIYTVRFPRGQGSVITSWLRRQVTIQADGDTWIGNGDTESASSQSGLSTAFPEPIVNSGAVEVYYNGALARYVTGAPTTADEWRWVETGSPAPVIEIGPGSAAGDLVTVRIPHR